MIWAAFTSEWTKLRRRTLLLSTFIGLAAAASLFVILLFSQAPATGDGGGLPSLQQLARPNGLIVGVTRATMLLGIVAFGIAAAQTASEYSLGTLRQLLVRQPRRVTLLAGKMLGVVTLPAARAVLRRTGRVRGGRDRGARPARADHGVVHRHRPRRPVPGAR